MPRKKMGDPGPAFRAAGYNPTDRFGDRVKVVEIPYASGNSAVDARAPVTIQRAPWEIAPAGGVQEESS